MTPTEREALERRAANLQGELDKLKADLTTPPRRGLVATEATNQAYQSAYMLSSGNSDVIWQPMTPHIVAALEAAAREMVARCMADLSRPSRTIGEATEGPQVELADGRRVPACLLRALFGLDEGGK